MHASKLLHAGKFCMPVGTPCTAVSTHGRIANSTRIFSYGSAFWGGGEVRGGTVVEDNMRHGMHTGQSLRGPRPQLHCIACIVTRRPPMCTMQCSACRR